VGHAVGVACGPRRFVGAALAQLPGLLVAVAAGWRFLAEPPVHSYNAILGFFPGNLYDENIRIGAALAWSRLEDAAWAAALVALVAWRLDVARHRLAWRGLGARPAGLAVTGALFAGAAGLHAAAPAHGYAIDAADLDRVLAGRIETAHFVIHYAHTAEIDDEIALIARDHELRYAQVAGLLGAAPPGKLTSYYFADRDQKARWFGARDVEMAKPWRHEIYLDHRPFPHPSLRHEIAHAVASAFGDPLFGTAVQHGVFVSPGLVEGLAVAADWPGSERQTPHEAVRLIAELGELPSIARLLSLEFFSVSSARGYTIAGSFLRFLLDRDGPAKLRAIYRSGGDFAAAYGVPLARLEADWRRMIAALPLPAGAVEAARERFRGTSVFARPCPHVIAARREEVGVALGAGDRPRAVALARAVCGDAPDEPRHRLELADVLGGGAPAERGEALAIWTALALGATGATSSLRVEAIERLARAAAARDDRATVQAQITAALALPLDAGERRQVVAEAFALGHRGPAATVLYRYFFAPAPIGAALLTELAVRAEPALGFAHYLRGLQQLGLADHAQAAASLARALALGLPDPAFVRNAARRLAVAAYRAHDPARVRIAIAALADPAMTEVDRLLAADWQARLAFDAAAP
jgi:hypothetical protein